MKDIISDSTKPGESPEQDHGERNKAYEKQQREVGLCNLEKTTSIFHNLSRATHRVSLNHNLTSCKKWNSNWKYGYSPWDWLSTKTGYPGRLNTSLEILKSQLGKTLSNPI